ncbi:MAG TPA: UDP-N-acetylmuramoyl-L-alanine--D-glutamate ligase [Stellaceae bacterium]|jgi:UDP-N-acetylmuramoyl-L-alanine---L-glutamate ligase|nr:UDP-N-acetylmuramoyl-L-alanine--D-glutamate ligase [Stellaceae bacterium]
MRVADLGSRRVAIWGLGREGRAAIGFLRKHHPRLPLVLLDDTAEVPVPEEYGSNVTFVFGAEGIANVLTEVDVVVKSPGVSLYRGDIQSTRKNGVQITSLLNLWFAEEPDLTTIAVTGTKGKSTTASLIAHILTRLGRRVALAGNIGVPVTEIGDADYAVIEVSSYQAADFDGVCDLAVLTSLYPEHADWHLTVERYIRDKVNLLIHSRCRIVNCAAADAADPVIADSPGSKYLFNKESGIHSQGAEIFDGRDWIGSVRNPYLVRAHNRSNLCAALTAAKILHLDLAAALDAARDFCGLPHRQQELGESRNILFVDDSISTIPESTIAALAVYADRDVTVIVGGYDRGIDYGKLVEALTSGAAKVVICIGDTGSRIYAQTRAALNRVGGSGSAIYRANSMEDAVLHAMRVTPPGGVVLLSPAAPSYGQYRDYIERGRDFAAKAGLTAL